MGWVGNQAACPDAEDEGKDWARKEEDRREGRTVGRLGLACGGIDWKQLQISTRGEVNKAFSSRHRTGPWLYRTATSRGTKGIASMNTETRTTYYSWNNIQPPVAWVSLTTDTEHLFRIYHWTHTVQWGKASTHKLYNAISKFLSFASSFGVFSLNCCEVWISKPLTLTD